jgi:hypothetical protein
MKNSTISTAKQLSKRIAQLNNLMVKFARVRSLVRKWAFELTILDGRLESLKAVKVVEKPIQLTIWDAVPQMIKTETPFEVSLRRRLIHEDWMRFNTLPEDIQEHLLDMLMTAQGSGILAIGCQVNLKKMKAKTDEELINDWAKFQSEKLQKA